MLTVFSLSFSFIYLLILKIKNIKKRNLKSLTLNKKTITQLQAVKNVGGIQQANRDRRGGASTTLCDSVNVCCA